MVIVSLNLHFTKGQFKILFIQNIRAADKRSFPIFVDVFIFLTSILLLTHFFTDPNNKSDTKLGKYVQCSTICKFCFEENCDTKD